MQFRSYVPYDINFGFEVPLVPGDGLQVKAVAFGDDNVGKAAVVERIRWGRYPPPKTTLKYSTEFVHKLVALRGWGNNSNTKDEEMSEAIKIELWNCSANNCLQNAEVPVLPGYLCRGTSVALFCFRHSTTSRLDDEESMAQLVEDTASQLRPWIEAVGTQFDGYTPLPVLVDHQVDGGVSADPHASTKFSVFDTQLLARVCELITQYLPDTIIPVERMRVFHVSARTGEGIDSLLQYIADTMKLISEQFPNGVSGGRPDAFLAGRPGAIKLPKPPTAKDGVPSSQWCRQS
jgi:hypothetical protein